MSPEQFLKARTSLEAIPVNERSRPLCEAAVQRNGAELKFVPLPLRTVRLTRLACGNHPPAYRFAPGGVRADYELATYALRRGGLRVWERIPEHIIDYALCLNGVRGCGALLGMVPPQFKSFELCKLAVTQGGADLAAVPGDFLRDKTFWTGIPLKYVPADQITYDLAIEGVKRNGSFLQYVPDHHRDILVCRAAVNHNVWACRFVPDRHHHHECIREAYAEAKAAGAPFVIPTLENKEVA